MNWSLSTFNSTVREYLDPLVKADKCAQYVDDIGIAASTVEELVDNIEAVFTKIRQAGLKLSMSKCAFGHPEIEFLGRSITSKGIGPIEKKIDGFLKNIKVPTSVKSLQRYIGFVQFYRQYIPRLAEKLVPLYKLLQKDVKFQLTQAHKDAIFDINENLANSAKMSLRLPLPDKQLVIMCDASEHAAGYVLLMKITLKPAKVRRGHMLQWRLVHKGSLRARCHSRCTRRSSWLCTSPSTSLLISCGV